MNWAAKAKRILKDDILSIERIDDLGKAESLLIRLPELVGDSLSINSLQEDLQTSHKTIKRWLDIFERFYVIFRISPFGSPKIKALKKEQKHYHFDWTLIQEPGFRFENLVACQLLKWCHFYEDTQGRDIELRFYKDDEQRAVDFVICENRKPLAFIEVKLAEKNISPHLKYLKKKFPETPAYQILLENKADFVNDEGIRLGPASKLFCEIKELISGIKS